MVQMPVGMLGLVLDDDVRRPKALAFDFVSHEPHASGALGMQAQRVDPCADRRQIDARIDQDSYISQQLTLWGQHGSDVIRGSLLIIPIEDSLIYVQPLYLVATDKGGLPELRRVIVAYGNEVVMEETLEAALQRLFTGLLPSMRMTQEGTAAVKEQPRQLGSRALEQLRKAREALRKEDWAGYGKYLKELEETLREMAK